MTIFISPAVNSTETDLTLTAQEKSDIIGATVIASPWGPVNVPTFISAGEDDMVTRFGRPDDNTYLPMLVAADFMRYSNKMRLIRAVGPLAKNSTSTGSGALVRNEDELETANLSGIPFLGRYPGSLGNGLIVDIVDGAAFDTWEFRSASGYRPQAGEFNIAVIDGSGRWTGAGSAKQTERLSVNGTVYGGTPQTQTVSFEGTVTGGVKQEETLIIAGQANDAALNVDGQAVTLVAGDDSATVAAKIAAVFTANSARYASAVALNNRVKVVFAEPAQQAKIADVNQSGVVVSSRVDVTGNDQFRVTLYGENLTLRNGDTYDVAADKFKAILQFDTGKYTNVQEATTASKVSLTYTFVEPGPQATTPTQDLGGLTVTTAVGTAGNGDVMISVFGMAIQVNHGDNAAAVAQAIYAEFKDAPGEMQSVVLDGTSVLYTYDSIGYKAKRAAPAAQSGLTFGVDIRTPGRIGTLLEKYELMSENPSAVLADGSTRYFVAAINQRSKYIAVGDKTEPLSRFTHTLNGGVDDYAGDFVAQIAKLNNAEQLDVNAIIAATNDITVQKAFMDVPESRYDCMGYASPMMADVVNNPGNEVPSVLDWRTVRTNRDTSYMFNDGNWAYVYDKYSRVYRWIPCCGGTAGLWARTAQNQEPWYSFAGHERGRYKGYEKLAWSPDKPQRDELYKVGVNPIINSPGEGILLYGDKTSLSRPSAFAHVNTRQAFIVAEKSIANLAKYYLFEFNDEFTRKAFVNSVRPLLRNMRDRRAFEDFRLIVDERNNGPEIRTQNRMVGTVLIKPLYSINYITLNYVAVDPGVEFDEIESQLFG